MPERVDCLGLARGGRGEENQDAQEQGGVEERLDPGLVERVEVRQPEGVFEESMETLDVPALAIGGQNALGVPFEAIGDQGQLLASGQSRNDQAYAGMGFGARSSQHDNSVELQALAADRARRREVANDAPSQGFGAHAQNEAHVRLEPAGNGGKREEPAIHKVNGPARRKGDAAHLVGVAPGASHGFQDRDGKLPASGAYAKRPHHAAANRSVVELLAAMPLGLGQRDRHRVERDEFLPAHLWAGGKALDQSANETQRGGSAQGVGKRAEIPGVQKVPASLDGLAQPGKTQEIGRHESTHQGRGGHLVAVVVGLDLTPEGPGELEGGKDAGKGC